MIEQTCQNGLLFNDVAGYCDFPFNVNCGDRPPATPSECDRESCGANGSFMMIPNGQFDPLIAISSFDRDFVYSISGSQSGLTCEKPKERQYHFDIIILT